MYFIISPSLLSFFLLSSLHSSYVSLLVSIIYYFYFNISPSPSLFLPPFFHCTLPIISILLSFSISASSSITLSLLSSLLLFPYAFLPSSFTTVTAPFPLSPSLLCFGYVSPSSFSYETLPVVLSTLLPLYVSPVSFY